MSKTVPNYALSISNGRVIIVDTMQLKPTIQPFLEQLRALPFVTDLAFPRKVAVPPEMWRPPGSAPPANPDTAQLVLPMLRGSFAGTKYQDRTVCVGAKVLKTCLDHIALEIGDAVNVPSAFLRAVAY